MSNIRISDGFELVKIIMVVTEVKESLSGMKKVIASNTFTALQMSLDYLVGRVREVDIFGK